MKDLRPALRAFLLADIGISALVDGRVFPLCLPQGETRPSLVYQTISGAGDYHMQGDSGLGSPRLQIDAWAKDVDVADLLARVVHDRLSGFSGVMGSGGDAVAVQGVFVAAVRESHDGDLKLYGIGRDFFIWHAAL